MFQAFCLSLHGSSLWKLDCSELNSLNVSFNNVIRRIWNLPRDSHTAIVHSVGSVVSIYNNVYSRFSRLCTSAISNPSCLIRSIFTVSSRTCNSNFIGYNCLYGDSHCKAYSSHHIAIGNLIREIHTQSVIPHISDIYFDAIVLSASTM